MCRLVFIFSLIFCQVGWAQQRGSTEEEFKIKKDHLQRRYQDFFIRENEADRRDRERQEASSEHKKVRQAIREEYEKTRLEFIANRKEKAVLSDEEHLKEIEAQKRAHEQARKEYIQRRNNLNSIESSTGVIPDWIEYRLYEPYETSDSPD